MLCSLSFQTLCQHVFLRRDHQKDNVFLECARPQHQLREQLCPESHLLKKTLYCHYHCYHRYHLFFIVVVAVTLPLTIMSTSTTIKITVIITKIMNTFTTQPSLSPPPTPPLCSYQHHHHHHSYRHRPHNR